MLVAGAGSIACGVALTGVRRAGIAVALLLQAAGTALVGAVGAVCLLDGRTVGAGFTSDLEPSLGVDPLSGLFLLLVALVAVPAALYAIPYLAGARRPRTLAALTGLFGLALAGVVTARDAVTFLALWEVMTLVPAAAILVARGDAPARRAVFEYLAVTRIGGAGVWVALLALAHHGALGDPAGLAAAGGGAQALVAVAGIVGFGTKAGLVPLHAWLPRAHPLAPSNVSAVMSGAMVSVALYGLARLLTGWPGGPPAWVGFTVLALGALSALTGILYAVFQADLKRLLAFSTIENAGIVTAALGAAALLEARGEARWAATALAAGLLHALAHALAKALLFLTAGSVERATGGLRIDAMGGLLGRMPATGGATLVGALALAGVPVLAGFASEWATLGALIELARADAVGTALAGALGAAALAATTGLAVVCFVALAGLALLGRPRGPGAAAATEVPGPMRWAPAALAAGCVALGVAPGPLMPALERLAPGGDGAEVAAGVGVPGASLPTLGAALALGGAAALLAVARGRRPRAAAPVWNCGQDAGRELAWTSAAFTKPLRLAFGGMLRPRRGVEVVARAGIVREIRHRGGVPHLFDSLLYGPTARAALAGAGAARRLQSGSIRQYIAALVGVVVLLLALARAGALG
ncbi:proton-conducting transporter membrane subunit [Miltoncostaea marina]|uniref:proton-conducting transporter transmembrane domain-containing protein n=1 Tax=Miltoncostaea marina TaxID=2843215 RepID=UPI001C3CEEF3|nr:proton-conducting transporter membrane subunit [Miltoncostaea marina]